ncbi:hypothetical protein KEM56_001940 [Ascosphaera pollenicola]|nr:hypothetical protein KEM56_001940 [Ascosphaera pollenicola]
MPPKSASSSNGNKGKGGFSRNSTPSSRPSRTPVTTRGPKANNKSITSFFKKAPGPPGNDQARITQFIARNRQNNGTVAADDTTGGLFFEDDDQPADVVKDEDNDTDSLFGGSMPAMSQHQQGYIETGIQNGGEKFHENEAAVKRRRLSVEDDEIRAARKPAIISEGTTPRRIGPFVDDSDDDDGNHHNESELPSANPNGTEPTSHSIKREMIGDASHSVPVIDEGLGSSVTHFDEHKQEMTCPICEVPLEGLTDLVSIEKIFKLRPH